MSHDPQEPLDEGIIAHLRSALDEVAAKPVAHAAHPAPVRRGLDARRWVAIAASAVIVAGAAVGTAMYRGDDTTVSSDPTTLTTAPSTDSFTMPYFLAAADLAPSEVGPSETVLLPGVLELMVWAPSGSLDALLRLAVIEVGATTNTTDVPPEATVREIDGLRLEFTSYGLTDDERNDLARQVIPGSGLPWLLPVDGWQMVAMLTPTDGPSHLQIFGSALMQVGPHVISSLFTIGTNDVTSVTVAGQPGLQTTGEGGFTTVYWREPVNGNWVSLSIPPALADRVDALIAAVVPTSVPGITITSDTLPQYVDGVDGAIGLTAPAVIGPGLDGNAVVIDPASTQRPTLVVFVANWCPHCHALLPNVQAWIADGTISADVDVVVVATAESTSAQSSAEWLAQLDWRTKVLVDAAPGDGQAGPVAQAYGAPGWPYLVLIAADGTVAARTSGEMTQSQMQQLLAAAA